MKTSRNKIVFGITIVIAIVGVAIGCSKMADTAPPDEMKGKLAISSTKASERDGIYTGTFTYYGEKLTVVQEVKDGIMIRTTLTNGDGEVVELKEAKELVSTFYKDEAQKLYLYYFEQYDCLQLTVTSKPPFMGVEGDYIYTIFGGPDRLLMS